MQFGESPLALVCHVAESQVRLQMRSQLRRDQVNEARGLRHCMVYVILRGCGIGMPGTQRAAMFTIVRFYLLVF